MEDSSMPAPCSETSPMWNRNDVIAEDYSFSWLEEERSRPAPSATWQRYESNNIFRLHLRVLCECARRYRRNERNKSKVTVTAGRVLRSRTVQTDNLRRVSPNSDNRVRKPSRARKYNARSTEYEVEEIVSRRLDPVVAKMGITTIDPTLYQYQLRWKGYQRTSWVPYEDLNCPELLNEFLKSVS